MKRLSSVIRVEEKPAVQMQRVQRNCRKHAATVPSSSSFSSLHRNNGMSNVSYRPRRRQSAVKSLSDATRGQDTEASTRLFISNIADEVPSLCHVIELLFEQIGRLRRHKIHFDPEGNFQGTAEVVYERWGDAIDAVRRYDNNINFFGRTWKVELVGENQVSLIEGRRPLAAVRLLRFLSSFNKNFSLIEAFTEISPHHQFFLLELVSRPCSPDYMNVALAGEMAGKEHRFMIPGNKIEMLIWKNTTGKDNQQVKEKDSPCEKHWMLTLTNIIRITQISAWRMSQSPALKSRVNSSKSFMFSF